MRVEDGYASFKNSIDVPWLVATLTGMIYRYDDSIPQNQLEDCNPGTLYAARLLVEPVQVQLPMKRTWRMAASILFWRERVKSS